MGTTRDEGVVLARRADGALRHRDQAPARGCAPRVRGDVQRQAEPEVRQGPVARFGRRGLLRSAAGAVDVRQHGRGSAALPQETRRTAKGRLRRFALAAIAEVAGPDTFTPWDRAMVERFVRFKVDEQAEVLEPMQLCGGWYALRTNDQHLGSRPEEHAPAVRRRRARHRRRGRRCPRADPVRPRIRPPQGFPHDLVTASTARPAARDPVAPASSRARAPSTGCR